LGGNVVFNDLKAAFPNGQVFLAHDFLDL